MEWVMSEHDAQKFKDQGSIRIVPDQVDKIKDNATIIKALEKELGADCNVWFEEKVEFRGFNRIRYEAFITGYLYFYDEHLRSGAINHGVYFKWRDDVVTVFLSPAAVPVLKTITYTLELTKMQTLGAAVPAGAQLIADAAAAPSDPPPPPSMPPPPKE